MKCPYCHSIDTQVKDSRPTEDNSAIRRRRSCQNCGARFTTFERVHLRDLIILKTNGKKETFDREKLVRSLLIACRKRPVDENRIQMLVDSIQRRLEGLGESEVPSELVGEIVMDALQSLDKVAYIRFASVYKNFREIKDFEGFFETIPKEAEGE